VSGGSLTIRPARKGEAGLVLQFVRELAEYEKLSHEVTATEAMLDAVLFAPTPRVFCDFAEWDGAPVGFAVWLFDYSTFSGAFGIYLEDIFVRPAFRGNGIGKALMAHLARQCAARGAAHLQWSVLDWNTPSINFYKSLGAVLKDEWTICRLGGDALKRRAERS
jgi:GNAT superfamily N-acetyltransferase